MFNFKSFASVIASALVIGFSSPALAGTECNSVKEFAQSIEQISGQKTTVECYEQFSVPVQTPSQEGANVFLSLAALLAGGWGLVAVLNMNKTQIKDWDYSCSMEPIPTINSSPNIQWEEEIFNLNDINWNDESSIRWEDDLNTSTIKWENLDISDICWDAKEEDLSSIIWWEDLI